LIKRKHQTGDQFQNQPFLKDLGSL